jgi:UDP-N-acetylglucosamine 3-dehydrogenase
VKTSTEGAPGTARLPDHAIRSRDPGAVRVLLVGAGRWGAQHLRVLRGLGADVWVADASPERRAWAVVQGIPVDRIAADHRAALDTVAAVDVVTPAGSHGAIAETSLRAGRACFVEKPLATSVAEARRLCQVARETGRALQVGHVFRFHPVTAALREALAAGRIGRVRFASGRFAGFKRPRTDAGVTMTDAIHFFDLFALLLGRAATRVTAHQRDFLGRGLDDMSAAIVEYGEVPVVVEANYFVPGTARECVIAGERGTLVGNYAEGTATAYAGEHRRCGERWEAVDRGKEILPVAEGEPLRLELQAFLDACRGRRACPVPGEDGLAALAVVEAAARSAAEGRAVEVAEILDS